MKMKIPNRIHIIGSVGSGKTTLARTLANKYNIPYFELDNVVWERHKSGDIRRSDIDREENLENIIHTELWIIEGTHFQPWVYKSLRSAELIVFLDTPYRLRGFRIIRRYIRQLIGVESANYTPSFSIFKAMFRWNKIFEKKSKSQILEMLQEEKMNYIILRNGKDIDHHFY